MLVGNFFGTKKNGVGGIFGTNSISYDLSVLLCSLSSADFNNNNTEFDWVGGCCG